MMHTRWYVTVVAITLLAWLAAGCDHDDSGSGPAEDAASDTASDQGGLDVPGPSDMAEEDQPPGDLPGPDTPPSDLAEVDTAPPDLSEMDWLPPVDLPDSDQPPSTVPVVGRVWIYTVSYPPLEFGYDYPHSQVTVEAYGAANELLATATTDIESCTPWDPPVPYTCGMFELELAPDREAMLKASNYSGYMNTLSQIFTVKPNTVRIMVMVPDLIVTLLSTVWSEELIETYGHLAGIVAVASNDVHAPPYEEYIGEASVEITPSSEFPEDYRLIYYDSENPQNTSRTSTDANSPVFAAINLPARGIDDPYQIAVTHATYQFEPVEFAIQPGVLTFVILSPQPAE
ncbi:MAG: hypothetical protein JW797_19900 [Bradymonadales bacterium]|nr:hypothetical protein [Bradymonadales bacterium]